MARSTRAYASHIALTAIAAIIVLFTSATVAFAQSYPGGNEGPGGGQGGSDASGTGVLGESQQSGGLAFTGADILLILAVAAVCILVGVAAIRFARRHRATA